MIEREKELTKILQEFFQNFHRESRITYTLCNAISPLPKGGGKYCYVKEEKDAAAPYPLIFTDDELNKMSKEQKLLFDSLTINSSFSAFTRDAETSVERKLFLYDADFLMDLKLRRKIKQFLHAYTLSGIYCKNPNEEIKKEILHILKIVYGELIADMVNLSMDRILKASEIARKEVFNILFKRNVLVYVSAEPFIEDDELENSNQSTVN